MNEGDEKKKYNGVVLVIYYNIIFSISFYYIMEITCCTDNS